MNKKLRRYYKKKMHGGRSVVARTIDFLVFRIMLLFSLFVLIFYLSRSITAGLFISVFLTVAVSLVITVFKRKKTQKYIQNDMQRIRQKCLLETLTFMTANEYAEFINRMFDNDLKDICMTNDGFIAEYHNMPMYVFHNHPSSQCEASDILYVFRMHKESKKIIVLSLSDMSDNAKKLCLSLPVKIEFVSGKKVLKIANDKDLMPDKKSAEENAEKEMNETIITFEAIKKTTFGQTKIKGYVVCGIIAMCWPFIAGFKFYFPIISMGCFALAILTYRKNKQAKESSDIEHPDLTNF